MIHIFVRVLLCTAAIAFVTVPVSARAQATDTHVVVIDGTSQSSEWGSDFKYYKSVTKKKLCGEDGREQLAKLLRPIEQHMNAQLAGASPDVQREWKSEMVKAANEADRARQEFCDSDGKEPPFNFRILYAHCRMLMLQGPMLMDVRFASNDGEGVLEIVNHETQQALVEPLSFTRLLNEDEGSPVSGKATNAPLTAQGSGTHLGLATTNYKFQFDFEINLPGMTAEQSQQMAAFGGLPKIRNTGNAWVAADAPGMDIVKAFYQTFAAAVSSGPGNNMLLGGLYNHMLLDKGLPLEMEQQSQMIMMGRTMTNQKTTTKIHRIGVLIMPGDFCSATSIPDDYEIVTVMGAPPGG